MSRPSSTNPPREAGRPRQKQRTRRLLLDTARSLLESGRQPTVTDVADAADVSRRTAYRYFPTQEKLLAESALEGLRPMMENALALTPAGDDQQDIEARIDALVGNMMKLAFENEPLLRTMIQQTVLEKSPTEMPRRGTRRIEWIEAAIAPLRSQLGKSHFTRLVSALAVCTGMEAILVLRDIRGLTQPQTIQVSKWMAQALLREALNGGKRKTDES
jgi:AcrR family transcriptional regulator